MRTCVAETRTGTRRSGSMKHSAIIASTLFLFGLSLVGTHARADDTSPTYSGDLLNRSTLTGDWGGARNDLAAKGFTIDFGLTQIEQGVVGGGKNSTWEYGGRGDLTANLDTQKAGWWPGGFMGLEVEGNFSKSVNRNTGALMAVNSSQIYPVTNNGDNLNISALNFAQFLSHYFGLTVGKYATITPTSGDMNEFAHGKGDTQFLNLAFNFNPILAVTVPYSTLGAGAILLPTTDPKEAIVTFLVLQSNGSAETSGFNDLDTNKLTFAGEGRFRTDFLDTPDTSFSVQRIRTKPLLRLIRVRAFSSRAITRFNRRMDPGRFTTTLISICTNRTKVQVKVSASSGDLELQTAILTLCITSIVLD